MKLRVLFAFILFSFLFTPVLWGVSSTAYDEDLVSLKEFSGLVNNFPFKDPSCPTHEEMLAWCTMVIEKIPDVCFKSLEFFEGDKKLLIQKWKYAIYEKRAKNLDKRGKIFASLSEIDYFIKEGNSSLNSALPKYLANDLIVDKDLFLAIKLILNKKLNYLICCFDVHKKYSSKKISECFVNHRENSESENSLLEKLKEGLKAGMEYYRDIYYANVFAKRYAHKQSVWPKIPVHPMNEPDKPYDAEELKIWQEENSKIHGHRLEMSGHKTVDEFYEKQKYVNEFGDEKNYSIKQIGFFKNNADLLNSITLLKARISRYETEYWEEGAFRDRHPAEGDVDRLVKNQGVKREYPFYNDLSQEIDRKSGADAVYKFTNEVQDAFDAAREGCNKGTLEGVTETLSVLEDLVLDEVETVKILFWRARSYYQQLGVYKLDKNPSVDLLERRIAKLNGFLDTVEKQRRMQRDWNIVSTLGKPTQKVLNVEIEKLIPKDADTSLAAKIIVEKPKNGDSHAEDIELKEAFSNNMWKNKLLDRYLKSALTRVIGKEKCVPVKWWHKNQPSVYQHVGTPHLKITLDKKINTKSWGELAGATVRCLTNSH